MTRGRRVQTSTLRRTVVDGNPAYVSTLTTQVPDLGTQELAVRRFYAIHWFWHRFWNKIELHEERPGSFTKAL